MGSRLAIDTPMPGVPTQQQSKSPQPFSLGFLNFQGQGLVGLSNLATDK